MLGKHLLPIAIYWCKHMSDTALLWTVFTIHVSSKTTQNVNAC